MSEELLDFIRERVSKDSVALAYERMERFRCPLEQADEAVYSEICNAIFDYGIAHIDLDIEVSDFDIEEIFFEL